MHIIYSVDVGTHTYVLYMCVCVCALHCMQLRQYRYKLLTNPLENSSARRPASLRIAHVRVI